MAVVKRLPILTTALLVMAWAGSAEAQNADPLFFGDEAALAAGAVVASGRDSGALWYNPAGFAGLKRGMVSASASTFGLRFRTIPNALRARIGGVESGDALSSTDVISVPNAIVAATALGDRYTLAGGLFTTERDIRSAFVSVPESPGVTADGTAVTTSQRLDLQGDRAKYHLGPAFAMELSDRTRFGIAIFGTYTKVTQNVQYAFNAFSGPNPTDERAFIAQSARITSSAVGLTGQVGVQHQVSRVVTLGLTIRAPEVALTSSSEGGAVLGSANAGGTEPPSANLVEQTPPELQATGKLLAPARALAGVAFALGPPASFIEAGLDFAHGLPASSILEAQQPTVNGRVGARYRLSPAWVVGGGIFSDRARKSSLAEFIASDRVDYYGLTVGVSKRTPLALVKDPQPEALVLVTTLSIRTALGFGEARALTIDLDAPTAGRDDRSSVLFVEVMPYLGSAVLF